MGDFKKLMVWEKGMKIVSEVYKISKNLPVEEKYGLVSQINRSAVSIPSNIAEGSSRESDKDFKRFLEIAMGSCFELETQLLIIINLNFTQQFEIKLLLDSIREEQRMIRGLINNLRLNY